MAIVKMVRIDDYGWLPIPDEFMKRLGWKEGDLLEVEVAGNSIILTKVDPQPKSKET